MKLYRDDLLWYYDNISVINDIRAMYIGVFMMILYTFYYFVMPFMIEAIHIEFFRMSIIKYSYYLFIIYIINKIIRKAVVPKRNLIRERKEYLEKSEEFKVEVNFKMILINIIRFYAVYMYVGVIPATYLMILTKLIE